MRTQLRTTGLGLLAATVVSLFGATSTYAFPGPRVRVQPLVPPPVVSPVVPRLGIMGHIDRGQGMHVESVRRGTPASRIGLEQGDLIVRINGQDITSERAYRQALLRAVQFDHGTLKMQIADVRTGRRVFRVGFLNTPPVTTPTRPYLTANNGHGHNHNHDHDDDRGQDEDEDGHRHGNRFNTPREDFQDARNDDENTAW